MASVHDAVGFVLAEGESTTTSCAEDDNINVPVAGSFTSFAIEATHPTTTSAPTPALPTSRGAESTDHLPTDFPYSSATRERDTPTGETVFKAVRDAAWWLPRGMTAYFDGEKLLDKAHRIVIHRKIHGVDSWPEVLALHADGNLRLIPHPPAGVDSVCFGTSVLVGPSASLRTPTRSHCLRSLSRAPPIRSSSPTSKATPQRSH